MDLLPIIITGAVTFLGGAGLWTYADHRKQYKEAKQDRQDEILKEIKALKEDVDNLRDEMHENDKRLNERLDLTSAEQARNRILRFDDELRRRVPHSEEFFNQISDDINYYNAYCKDHPEYENSRAGRAMQNILDCYQTVKKNDEFI